LALGKASLLGTWLHKFDKGKVLRPVVELAAKLQDASVGKTSWASVGKTCFAQLRSS
jgi:hypothetical protein